MEFGTLQGFLVRLFIGIGIIWLIEHTMATLSIKEPSQKIINLIVLIAMILFILLGGIVFGGILK